MDAKPGDIIKVKVGGKDYDTSIDPDGVQRFKANGAVNWLLHFAKSDGCALNDMAMAFCEGKFTQSDFAEFYMSLGYSVCGFCELSFFEGLEMEVVNPLWGGGR